MFWGISCEKSRFYAKKYQISPTPIDSSLKPLIKIMQSCKCFPYVTKLYPSHRDGEQMYEFIVIVLSLHVVLLVLISNNVLTNLIG